MSFTSGLFLLFLATAAWANNNCLIYSSLQCSQCAQGYFLSTNFTCLACPTGCSQCLSASQCTNCYSNYILTNILCQQGPMNCLQVNPITGACVQCLLGFFLDGTQCAACPSFCVNCTMTQCLNCSLGFGINYDANETCYVCSGGCMNCETSNSLSTCLSCPLGSYVSGNTCQPCEQNCDSCSGSPTNCSACIIGYYLEANLCTACPNGCLSCSASTFCTACNAQFYLSQSNACVACGEQCYNCTQDECTSCVANYYLSNGSCIHCGVACTECTSTGCLSCSDSYYNNGGVCTLCPSYCATCSSPTQCQSCTSIYNTTYAGQCVPCNSVIGGCSTCSSSINCLTCQSGYSFQDGNCYFEQDGLGVGYIVLIVFGCLFIAGIIGYAIYAFWNRRKGFMGPEAAGDGSSIKATYYQIP